MKQRSSSLPPSIDGSKHGACCGEKMSLTNPLSSFLRVIPFPLQPGRPKLKRPAAKLCHAAAPLLPPRPPFSLRAGAIGPGQFTLWLDGQAGQIYVLQSSTNLAHWVPVSTNTLSSNSHAFVLAPGSATRQFYRAFLLAP